MHVVLRLPRGERARPGPKHPCVIRSPRHPCPLIEGQCRPCHVDDGNHQHSSVRQAQLYNTIDLEIHHLLRVSIRRFTFIPTHLPVSTSAGAQFEPRGVL